MMALLRRGGVRMRMRVRVSTPHGEQLIDDQTDVMSINIFDLKAAAAKHSGTLLLRHFTEEPREETGLFPAGFISGSDTFPRNIQAAYQLAEAGLYGGKETGGVATC